jgi:uncharacterized protein
VGKVTRHPSAESFLTAARANLMIAEAENNLILGVAEGLARNPAAAANAYLATIGNGPHVLASAVYISPYKLLLTRADRDQIAALARDAFAAVPGVESVIGPGQSAADFAGEWTKLSGVNARSGMRMRIHETRGVSDSGFPAPPGALRSADLADQALLTIWTDEFVAEARIPEKFDSGTIVADGIRRGRLYVWDDKGPKSMAAWTGRTENGVRINFLYTPQEQRGQGYATACIKSLTQQQLERGSAFCWLYSDLSNAASPGLFKRIGYWPVSDVSEYYLRPEQAR